MTFVYPEFLFALGALSIPVIIHLFNFRKFRKVVFTNVRFLQEIKKDTVSRTRVKHLLVLLLRLLAVLFLVFAFARPFLPGEQIHASGTSSPVSIFLDNSFSMQAIGKNGAILDEGKRKVKEILGAYNASTRFQLLTCDFEARHQRLYNKPEILQMLDEVKLSPSVKTISEIVPRQTDVLKSAGNKGGSAFIISDFQKSMFDPELLKPDSLVSCRLIPLAAQKNDNLVLDSCYFSSPVFQAGQGLEIVAILKNNSANTAENIPCKLFINGKQKGLSSLTLEAGAKKEIRIPFSIPDTGFQSGMVAITDYPITFDDSYFFSFNMAAKAPILCISGTGENKFINGLYHSDSFFDLKNVSDKQIDFSSFPAFRVIVVNEVKNISSGLSEELKKYVANGGCVMIFPATDAETGSYNTFMSSLGANGFSGLSSAATKIDKLNTEDELLKDVFVKIPENMDLPEVKKYYTRNRSSHSAEEILMKLQNGENFLSRYTFGKGKLYVFASPLETDFTNFAKHALFVPVMYKITLLGAKQDPLSYTIGKEEAIETEESPAGGENVVHLHKSDGSFDFIPEIKNLNGRPQLLMHGQVKESGNYIVSAAKPISAISFNYDRKESERECLSSDNLSSLIEKAGLKNIRLLNSEAKNFSADLSAAETGTQLWKYCLLLALLFLGAEVLVLRLWK